MERDRKYGRCNATTYRSTMPFSGDYGILVNEMKGEARASPQRGSDESRLRTRLLTQTGHFHTPTTSASLRAEKLSDIIQESVADFTRIRNWDGYLLVFFPIFPSSAGPSPFCKDHSESGLLPPVGNCIFFLSPSPSLCHPEPVEGISVSVRFPPKSGHPLRENLHPKYGREGRCKWESNDRSTRTVSRQGWHLTR